MAANRPFIVIVPGASQNPSMYGHLSHLLQLAGYPTYSALLPSVGTRANVTAEDDMNYVRNNMLLPVLDEEKHDVILFMHSYSSVPGSGAAAGLSKAERLAEGKKTGIIGQVYLTALLPKGGDGKDVVGTFGGQYPPHIRPEPENNILRCDDRVPPLFQDVPENLADVLGVASMAQGMSSFTSPCPRATWDSEYYKGRVAYIQTLKDAAIPHHLQEMMIKGTEVDWIVKDMDSGHSPQVSQPENLVSILLDLAKTFENL